MNPLLRFEHMLSNYRSLFKSNQGYLVLGVLVVSYHKR